MAPASQGAPLLLARYAESLLWFARYLERIENVARILDVTQTFSHGESDGQSWGSVLRINADEDRFTEEHGRADARSVPRFYLLDRTNPTSIPMAMVQVRENARTLRALISTEMWLQINVFDARIRALSEADVAPDRLSRTCAMLKEGCQAQAGIIDGTFYRDQGWVFYEIGRHLERADQTTRLLDIGWRALAVGDEASAQALASEAKAAQWTVLLRAAAGYHAFRRVSPSGFRATTVFGFLLLDGAFPRSVGLNLGQIAWHLSHLRTQHGLRTGNAALERIGDLRAELTALAIEDLLRRDPAPFLDWLQAQFAKLHDDIGRAFFPWEPTAPVS